jgi:ribonuclease P protein component
VRNRARRRLREVARRVLMIKGREGWDYVLIARGETTVARTFGNLVTDLERALDRLHGQAR